MLRLARDQAVPGRGQASGAHHLGGDPLHVVDRQGEADPLGPGPDGDVDADQLAVDVDQRPARVARVDAGVGLDQVAVDLLVGEGHVPLQGADDPDGDGVLVAEGVADRDDVLADHQVGRRADRDRGQGAAGVDLEHRQVHRLVLLDHPGRVARAVGEVDLDPLDLVDDVLVRQDVAPAVDDHPGPHPADPRPLVLLGREGPAARRGRLLLAGDAHHAGLDPLHRLDHRASAVEAAQAGRGAGHARTARPRSATSRLASVLVATRAVARWWSPLEMTGSDRQTGSTRRLGAGGLVASPSRTAERLLAGIHALPRRIDPRWRTSDLLWIGYPNSQLECRRLF